MMGCSERSGGLDAETALRFWAGRSLAVVRASIVSFYMFCEV